MGKTTLIHLIAVLFLVAGTATSTQAQKKGENKFEKFLTEKILMAGT